MFGEGGVGKTTLLKQHLNGEFERGYVATLGVDVHPIVFNTNLGLFELQIWDCAGQDKFGGLRDGYFIQSYAAICMFDLTAACTYRNCGKWIKDFKRICPDAPVILCGNKVDIPERKVKSSEIRPQILGADYYCDISAKSNYNFEKPFLEILKRLVSPDIQII